MSDEPSPPSPQKTLSQRLPLPEGTLPVAIGLLVAGICSFAFFRVGKFALGDEESFKPVTALWFATFALAPGFFLPLEQELGRALSARRALRQGGRPVVDKVVRLGLLLAATVTIGLVMAAPWLHDELFEGNWFMVAALVVAILAYVPAHLARGICAGTGRFRAYGIVLGADGVSRIVFCLVLAALGVEAVGAFGFAVAVAPLVGVLIVAGQRQLGTLPGPPAPWAEVTPNLGWLLLGSVMAAVLVNAGPLALGFLADPDQDAAVTRFGYGVILARVPLFLFQAVQAALLPRLARLAATGEMREFRHGFRKLMIIVLAVGAIGTVGAYVAGPLAVEMLYDAELTRRTLTVLALGSVFYMVALATAQAVIALKGHALVALGWTIGVVVFLIVLFSTPTGADWTFKRVELSVLAGSAAAMLSFLIALYQRLQAGATADAGSVSDALRDLPIEG